MNRASHPRSIDWSVNHSVRRISSLGRLRRTRRGLTFCGLAPPVVVSDLVLWLRGHWLVSLLVLLGLAGLGVGVYLAVSDDSEPETVNTPPAPRVVIKEDAPAPEEPTDLGFPAFATKNTTRVAGADPIGDAAGSALAVYPSTGGVEGPDAVTLVDADDWQAGVAAASLVAAPVSAPILIGDGGELPELTATAIRSLAPAG